MTASALEASVGRRRLWWGQPTRYTGAEDEIRAVLGRRSGRDERLYPEAGGSPACISSG